MEKQYSIGRLSVGSIAWLIENETSGSFSRFLLRSVSDTVGSKIFPGKIPLGSVGNFINYWRSIFN